MDRSKFDFVNLKTTGIPDEDGDKAFDEEEFKEAALPGIQVVTL
jgi:tRNA 2-thiocytidine biosynthesis protein TtcA